MTTATLPLRLPLTANTDGGTEADRFDPRLWTPEDLIRCGLARWPGPIARPRRRRTLALVGAVVALGAAYAAVGVAGIVGVFGRVVKR